MKKMRAIVSLMIIFSLIITCCPACGESCYVALRELLSSESQEDLYLGKGRSSDTEATKDISVVYVEKDEAFYIVGVNELNKGEITIWKNIDATRGYYMIYALSGIWDVLQENMDPGFSITLGITDMEMVEGDWVIDDKESAEAFVEVMEQVFSSMISE